MVAVEDLKMILSRAKEQDGFYRFDFDCLTYHPNNSRALFIEKKLYGEKGWRRGMGPTPTLPIIGPASGYFLYDVKTDSGDLFIEKVFCDEIKNIDMITVIPSQSLPPNKHYVKDFNNYNLNYDVNHKKISIYTIDIERSNWSIHCGIF